MKRTKFVVLLFVLVFLCTSFMGCQTKSDDASLTDEELIEKRVETFLSAYNSGDMEMVLNCLDAKSRNKFQAMLDLFGGVVGSYAGFDIDMADLFSLGVSMSSDDFMKLEISDISILDDENAIVTTKMELMSETQIMYITMVYENDGWYISDMTDEQNVSVNNSNYDIIEDQNDSETESSQYEANIEILNLGNVVKGTAVVKFTKNDEAYSGIMNADGEIFYYCEGEYINWTPIGNGSGYLTEESVYTIINSSGQETATSANGDFDKIIGSGDGLVLVYKDTSNIAVEEHSYGIIDSEGNWVKTLTPGTELPIPDPWNWSEFEYMGEGIFKTWNYYGYSNNYILYNSNTNQSFLLENCIIRGDKFVNGVVYGIGDDAKVSYYKSNDNILKLPNYFAFHTDATYEEVMEFSFGNNEMLISSSSEYMQIYDKVNNTNSEYKDYPASAVMSVEFIDNYGLVTLSGADNKFYFTVIDRVGNQQFEPKVYEQVCFSDDRVVYKTTEGFYEMIDINGNCIISQDKGYTYIGEFSDGIAYAENNNTQCYLDINGKTVMIKFYN